LVQQEEVHLLSKRLEEFKLENESLADDLLSVKEEKKCLEDIYAQLLIEHEQLLKNSKDLRSELDQKEDEIKKKSLELEQEKRSYNENLFDQQEKAEKKVLEVEQIIRTASDEHNAYKSKTKFISLFCIRFFFSYCY
jgi:hypothetical protein